MKFKVHSIKTQIIVTLFVVMSTTFLGLIYISADRLKELPDVALKQYQEIAQSRANELGNEVRGLQNQVEMIALSNVVQSMVLEDIQSYLLSVATQNRFRNFTFATPDGVAWASYDQFINISAQEQYVEIFGHQKTAYMSRPFYSPFISDKYPIITISHAIVKDDVTVGLVNGVVSTVFINELLASITFQQDGFAWIIDDRGSVVAYPDESITINQTFTDITQVDLTELVSTNTNSFQFDHNGVNYLSVYTEIPYTQGWTLILSFNQAQAFGWISAIVNSMYISLSLTLVLLLIVLFFSTNAIITPLLKLKEAFEEAKRGNLNVRADESIRNEIGEVAQSFNAMLDQIKSLTYRDPITGLNNFFSFLNEMPRVCKELSKTNQKVYVVILSIDDFKRINSLYGYDIGNETLRVMSKVVQSLLKDNEMMARYFGDEMILSLIENDEETVLQRMKEIVAQVKKPFLVQSVDVHLDVSCGLALYSETLEFSDVIRQATLAKHRAKVDVDSRVVVYSEQLYQDLLKEQDLKEALSHALEHNELYLVYQPIHYLKDRKSIGYEALLRWNHPRYKTVPIIEVINVAERTGLINDIGKFVLKTAVMKLIELNSVDSSLVISINVSPFQLQNQGFIEHAQHVTKELNFNPKNLVIEITESATMFDVEEKKEVLGRLKSLGFSIAIDDFGTGYSSLIYIAKLPIDIIKIDREFISKVEFDAYAQVLIASILSIAKTLNLRVIAEGVETLEQSSALEALGCDYIQGYLISMPIELN